MKSKVLKPDQVARVVYACKMAITSLERSAKQLAVADYIDQTVKTEIINSLDGQVQQLRDLQRFLES